MADVNGGSESGGADKTMGKGNAAKTRKKRLQTHKCRTEKPGVSSTCAIDRACGSQRILDVANIVKNSEQAVGLTAPLPYTTLWDSTRKALDMLWNHEQNITSIEKITITEDAQTQSKFDFVMGYATRCLLPYAVTNPTQRPSSVDPKVVAEIYAAERQHQLTPAENAARFTEIMALVSEFLPPNLFRFVLRSPHLIPCLLHFLYYDPSLTESEGVYTILKDFWIRQLMFTLSPDHGFRVVLFHLHNPECVPLQTCAIRGLLDFIALRDNLIRILLRSVTEASWYNDCTVFQATVLKLMDYASTTEDLVQTYHMLLDESVAILQSGSESTGKGTVPTVPLPVRRVALAISMGLNKICYHVLKGYPPDNASLLSLYMPISKFYQYATVKKEKLSGVVNLLKLYAMLLELPDSSKPTDFLAYRSHWFCLTSVYEAVSRYLEGLVVEAESSKFLTEVKKEVGDFIVKLVENYAKIEPEKLGDQAKTRKLAEFVVSLILVRRGDNGLLRAEVMPSGVSDEESEVDGNHGDGQEMLVDSFQRWPLKNEDIPGHLLSSTKHLARLLVTQLDLEVKNLLFGQLLDFGGESLTVSQPKQKEGIQYKAEEPKVDFGNYSTVQSLIASLIVAEFGAEGPAFADFMEGVAYSDYPLTYINMVFEKLINDMTNWIGGEEPSFESLYSATLVQTFDLVSVVIDETYDEEKKARSSQKNKPSEGGDADTLLREALIGWENLDKIKPYLTKISEFKHPVFVQGGISNRAQELIGLIETRGRGRGGASVGGGTNGSAVGPHGSKGTVEEAIFSLSSAIPGTVAMGLIQLKKLIMEHNSSVETNFDLIKQRLLLTLENKDEFIYNHCINAVVALTVEHHAKLLVEILSLFTAEEPQPKYRTAEMLPQDEVNFRLKVAEILCKSFASLGPIAAIYMIPVLNASFNLTRGRSFSQIKVSAYQIVAAIVPQLGNNLDQTLVMMYDWLETGLENESAEVRTAVWYVMEAVFTAITFRREPGGENAMFFAKCASARSKLEPDGEDLREKGAREAVRRAAQQLAIDMVDVSCQKLSRIQMLD